MPTLDVEQEIKRLQLALQKEKDNIKEPLDNENWGNLKNVVESIIRIEANIQYFKAKLTNE